jgi:hypothetical protein
MLGKLRTSLSDESFRASLLLRSWQKAGLLPELKDMAQCLRDHELAKTTGTKRHRIDNERVGRTPRKKARKGISSAGPNSSDTNI